MAAAALHALVALAMHWVAFVAGDVSSRPHVVFILVDDLGYNDVSWHNPAVKMPNIASLAAEGVTLEQSYVLPVCTPTRSAILTGRYPYTIGRQSSALKPLRPTGLTLNATLLPEALKTVGYHTHAVGKWHLGFCKWQYTPTYRGFDSFFGFYTGGQKYYTKIKKADLKLDGGRKLVVAGYDFRSDKKVFFPPEEEYSSLTFARRARDVILTHGSSADGPLFLYLPFQSVHGPLQVPERYFNMYRGIDDTNRRIFLGMVSALDDAVGIVVSALRSSGLYNNSVIVFTSDNGGSTKGAGSNWPLKGHKSTLWEGGVRVPGFVHSPLLSSPGVYRGLFHAVDWFATIAGLAGAAVPPEVDGVDQWAALAGREAPARDSFVYNIAYSQDALKAAVR
ncbi:arylsulfatase B [Hyalella azteca]|uniref:Arylsulfatase B n=1 Tax=Hyalella azteca TaxID=294128 RepID=A0A8B7N959_HYAAZ|nr:arylsulfatase B [Hyalella azteca]